MKLAPQRRVPLGQPAIAPALRNDWCTPDEVLLPAVYPILGDEVGIDPCSNEHSIVRAARRVVLPEGAGELDPVGGLVVPWHEHATFFCNPPFGDKIVNSWVAKAIAEAELGAEGILLLPAYVSSYFFADIWNAAQVICFWGIPGEVNSRVKFEGAKDSATFPIMLAYFGPRVALAADVLARVGQIVPPWIVHSWLHMIRGDVIPSLRGEGFDQAIYTDPIYRAMRRACAQHYDALITACAPVESCTIADLVSQNHPLIDDLLCLTVGEIAGGLAALQKVEPTARSCPTARKNRRSRGKKALPPSEPDSDQLELVLRSPAQKAREDLDRRMLTELRENHEEGLLAADLRKRVDCTPSQFRGSIKRLTANSRIVRKGKTSTTRYYPTRPDPI